MSNFYFCLKPVELKELFLKYKSVIRFIVLFLGSYLILSMLYSYYLSVSQEGNYYPDYITHIVAKQSSSLIELFGYDSKIEPHPNDPSMKLFVNEDYMVRIVEGCNAASIIILFISFIISFADNFRKTILFLAIGGLLIYLVNLIRIAVLTIMYYEFPQYQETLHSVVFPAIIYGMVFLLWMIWVRLLTKTKIKNA